MCRPALDTAELDLDGPLPHVTVLRDELPPTFQDDSAGAEEAVEARGEHTLAEKFGERRSGLPGFGPLGQPFGLGREEGPCSGLVGTGQEVQPPARFAQGVQASAWAALGPGSRLGPSRAPASGSLLPPCPWGLARAEGAFVPASGPWPERAPEHPSRAGPEAPLRPPPVCLDDSFGPDCSLTCDDCSNGGACLPGLDGCHCPEGWTGLVCNESEAAAPGPLDAPTSSSSLAPGGGPRGAIRSLIGLVSTDHPLCQALSQVLGGPGKEQGPASACHRRQTGVQLRRRGVSEEERLVGGPVVPRPRWERGVPRPHGTSVAGGRLKTAARAHGPRAGLALVLWSRPW